MKSPGLAVIETHPVQYHAPVYRALQERFGVPVIAIYGSDRSVKGYRDPEFGVDLAWDTDLLAGYESVFLSRDASDGNISERDLRKALHESRPAVVLNLGYSPAFYGRAVRASNASRIPWMLRGETTDHAEARSKTKRLLRDAYLKRVYGSASALLYIGQHSLTHYERLGVPKKKLWFSPYCVDTTPFKPYEDDRRQVRSDARRELQVSEDSFLLLFSGKVSERKGVDVLLNSAKALDEEFRSKFAIAFLGAGDRTDLLRNAAREEPRVETRFIGFKNQSELSRYYHAADALVLPSLRGETWGLVVNEALHHGLPCLVTDAVGCAPDLVHDGTTGFVVRAGSETDLTDGIKRLRGLIASANTRQACRDVVATYSVDAAAKGIADAFKAVVGEA